MVEEGLMLELGALVCLYLMDSGSDLLALASLEVFTEIQVSSNYGARL